MTFSYVTADYRCTKCDCKRSEHANAVSVPYLLVASFGTLVLSVVLFRTPWSFPWYYLISIFALEILLLFVAGFPLTLFRIVTRSGSICRRCPNCGEPMMFCGRHFTTAKMPHRTDWVLFFTFTAINIAVVLGLLFWATPRG